MTFGDLLREKKAAVVGRWLDGVLLTYGKDSHAAFTRQKDPHANPVGHGLRVALPAVFEALLDGPDNESAGPDREESAGPDREEIRRHLHEIVKVRAVQEFSPSDGVGFVFLLKEAIRAELPKAVGDPRYAAELADVQRRIDQLALAAFDIYCECRQRLYELRLSEVKRTIPWVEQKMSERNCCDPGPARVELQ